MLCILKVSTALTKASRPPSRPQIVYNIFDMDCFLLLTPPIVSMRDGHKCNLWGFCGRVRLLTHWTSILQDLVPHRYVKARLLFLQKILNKAIYNCSFANLIPVFTIFGIVVNNAIIDRSPGHQIFVAMDTIWAGKYVTIVTKIGILLN